MNTNAIPAANRNVDRGDNVVNQAEKIDYAKIETERLCKEYEGLWATFRRLKGEAAAIPAVINDNQTALAAGGVIKALRDLRATMENTRKVEGEPHLRRKNAVDATFGAYTEEIQPDQPRARLNNPGIIDQTQEKINGHQNRKEAAERARLAAAKAEQDRIAREAQEKADREAAAAREAQRVAREAEERAQRARTEESRAARQREADAAKIEADKKTADAKQAEVSAGQAAESSQDSRIATLARPADVVRTKGQTAEGGGVLLTKGTEKFAYLVDRAALTDEAKLALFDGFTDEEVNKAVRAYAVQTRHLKTLPGCEIGTRQKNVTR